MGNTYIESIYRKCLSNTATSAERQQFIEWVKAPQNEKIAKELLLSAVYEYGLDLEHPDHQTEAGILEAIFNADREEVQTYGYQQPQVATTHRIHFLKTAWFRYAALFILIAGTATLWYTKSNPKKEIAQQQRADIEPGGNKAKLTLADGTVVWLDSAANGNIAQQGNTTIIKLDNGQLAYNLQSAKNNNSTNDLLAESPSSYNTITTPRGGRYQITLPDGTKVWLNAASSIQFPPAFRTERKVIITGEVYLEVAQNKSLPFYVNAGGVDIQVLGTSFNINAYEDEGSPQTTLLNGSVKVVGGGQSVVLKPGQQAISKDDQLQVIPDVNLNQVIAWKNGLFDFDNKTLEEVMKQLCRWYDVEADYPASIRNTKFGGKMEQNLTLVQMLELLDGVDMRLNLEGRTIRVTKQ